MGNQHSTHLAEKFRKSKFDKESSTLSASVLPSEPGRPVVRLAEALTDPDAEVTDEITLKWNPPTKRGNFKIQGYLIEMWDLGSREWVRVTGTHDGKVTECQLSNILSGMLYKFRVSAVTEAGPSLPSLPSDAFVVNVPGVHIAPYYICPPPDKIRERVHETLTLRIEALGTPKPNFHWYKDDDEIFLAEGVTVVNRDYSSELIVENLQPADAGIIRCSAINTVGRADWETIVDLFAVPEFRVSNKILKNVLLFREDELIRLKLPLISIPEAEVAVFKAVTEEEGEEKESGGGDSAKIIRGDGFVVFKIDSAKVQHSGKWIVTAKNEHGTAEIEFEIVVETVPSAPGRPSVRLSEDSNTEVTLSWSPSPTSLSSSSSSNSNSTSSSDVRYLVEYYRDHWQLWLKARYSDTTSCTVTDLIPGSYYRFRIKALTSVGTSEPGEHSEEVLIGCQDDEDQLFGLPGGNYPKGMMLSPSRKVSSLSDVHRESKRLRQVSLEREVYYDRDVRKEVVTYKPTKALTSSMTTEEYEIYRRSMTDLCSKLMKVSSSTSLNNGSKVKKNSLFGSNISNYKLTDKEAQRYRSSMTALCQTLQSVSSERLSSTSPLAPPPTRPPRNKRKGKLCDSTSDVRKSMTELRCRISSLQGLLRPPSKMNYENEQEVVSVQNDSGVIETHFLAEKDVLEKIQNVSDDVKIDVYEDDTTLVESSHHGVTTTTGSKTLKVHQEDCDTDHNLSDFASFDLD